MRILTTCLATWAIIDLSIGVSTKMDFNDDESTSVVTNSSTTDDDDVEVKHTIVVSTKLKNNNRKGVRSSDGKEGDAGTLSYNIGQRNHKKEDSGEVPVVTGYKSVESTKIRTPDTRHKSIIYPEAIFVSRNIRDEYDNVYPNVAANPMQWKPSSFYNNINNWTPDNGMASYNNNLGRKRPVYQNPEKLHRKITEDATREFYCRKCVELSHGQGLRGCSSSVVQQRSANPWVPQTTTPKMKIDGKLAKLN